ncbi:Xylose isomerase-like TIM barrel protein [Pseudooceanicola batsensis HTCC2597]|uniref:Xylose isomerase-like TIM barrel protein n=1 Tax=Pseudooceanicola batsensis (strain ATCC BAA-863 / DSM 15984 / KCTC 12145 / HTCC2597) TaxID=252305 RepID=A3TW27_PSEBH|nr:TIM barrel protein [Pseudooceanicola batsensis]EAQ03823.1 Xylose isomerase-like TIM barrel protein [Pseudooceanicola batsensis HTCC2597]
MPRFCANLSFLWKDLPLPARISAAAEAGFSGVEILFPYDDPVPEVRDALARTGLPLVLINCPPPNYAGGDRGFAAVPGLGGRFRSDFLRALRYARALGVEHLHIMSGAAEGAEAEACLVDNLAWACAEAPGQSLTIEPINGADMPGYFMNDFDLALRVIDRVGAANLGLQFDAYHAHRITGDLLGTWARAAPRVRHVQFADHPGRHEPGTGEVDLGAFFERLDADGFAGWVSAEYVPSSSPEASLGWMGSADSS